MKRIYLSALTGFVAALFVISQKADAKPAAKASAQCITLRQQYATEIDTASRYRALNLALGDSSEPSQQTANETKESNALARARMAADALKSAGCKAPVIVPSPKPYMPAANRCKLDSIMARYGSAEATTCDPTRWDASRPK